jgi:catechol 2,3-dioxygenase-like lactoylglutathione lyase family enzyme
MRAANQSTRLHGFHHVAYRCRDAKRTVEFYRDVLGMDFQLAIAEDRVPSTGDPDPYMHVFLDAGNGNVLAFFELPGAPEMGRDEATPQWVQHIAFRVADMDSLIGLRCSGRSTMASSNRYISSIPTATGWSLPAISAHQRSLKSCTASPPPCSKNGRGPGRRRSTPPGCMR